MLQLIKRSIKYVKKNGVGSFVPRAKRYIHDKNAIKVYYRKSRLTDEEIKRQKEEAFSYRPKFSIIIPLYKTPVKFFNELIYTIQNQTYDNWELCLADGTASEHEVAGICRRLAANDTRIKYKLLKSNGGISENTNEALRMADGDFVVLADHDDLLELNALYECVKVLNINENIDSIYTDEDKIDMEGKRKFDPHFKPDFNIEYLRTNNYICHMFVTRRSIAVEAGGFDKNYDGAQDFDFIFKCTEKSREVYHIPMLLYHWRCHKNSTAAVPESKLYAYESGARAVHDHYARCGIETSVSMVENCYGYYKAKRNIEEQPDYIERIVLSEDNSLEEAATKCINEKIRTSEAEYILLCDSGIEAGENEIQGLMEYAADSQVCAVGARIYDDEDRLIQGSIIMGMNGFFDYSFKGAVKEDKGYFFRIVMPQNTTALDARCTIIKKSIVQKLGGLDESMPLGLAIIDYCMKAKSEGCRAVYNPYVTVKYTGKCKFPQYSDIQKKNFADKWKEAIEKGDNYFNKNFDINRTEYIVKS